MKIIFLGTTGVHHSLIAAYIYLDELKQKEFAMVKDFSDGYKDTSGFPIFIDRDNHGNQVYSLGAGGNVQMVKKTIEDLVSVLGFNAGDLVVKPIRIKGENLLLWMGRIPKIIGGSVINLFISNYIVKREYFRILKNVEDFRIEFSNRPS